MNYYISIKTGKSFEETEKVLRALLKEEGFGVLTEINIQDKFKEKLDVDFQAYKILGACNPALALKALREEDKIGVLLPCNVIIQQCKDGDVEVAAMDPLEVMKGLDNPILDDMAGEVRNKMMRALENLKGGM